MFLFLLRIRSLARELSRSRFGSPQRYSARSRGSPSGSIGGVVVGPTALWRCVRGQSRDCPRVAALKLGSWLRGVNIGELRVLSPECLGFDTPGNAAVAVGVKSPRAGPGPCAIRWSAAAPALHGAVRLCPRPVRPRLSGRQASRRRRAAGPARGVRLLGCRACTRVCPDSRGECASSSGGPAGEPKLADYRPPG